jgi:hypothetical protein
MPARLAIFVTVTSSDRASPISAIVARTIASLRRGSIPTLGIAVSFLLAGKTVEMRV